MNTGTGEIVNWDIIKKMKDDKNPTANFYKEIPNEVLPELQGMNRKQRRDWYKRNKKLLSKGA